MFVSVEHSISQLARLAGISSRTLRHYHDIGLLVPSRISSSGYRWYGRRQLLRLQRILLLRELDVPLSQMREILDGQTDELTALRRHRGELVGERDRLQQVIDTVERTIATLCGDSTVSDEEFFAGLAVGRSRLREDLADRYGAAAREHFVAAGEATAGWGRQDYQRAAAEGRHLLDEMSRARALGIAPDATEALDLVTRHHAQVLAVWPADAAAYHALGDLLLDNPDQRAMIAQVDPDLPPWLSAAIKAYAVHRLGHQPT
ncbi:MerR family transcriptional regulator [Geodermatophilus sp. TF02-6]|uniref:MerR family transcriptional regulator n=1 Tax=Geodermatophilus sp. TF02-6 TaxID=2250575 RepID=UPI000DE97B33|nr:MerR family transcriptional regulator [Geodermatophilus sp. TF02-6]RBY81680.1 MerR family transcriptional regulator [Geodermatophilus sp. TF02-6]